LDEKMNNTETTQTDEHTNHNKPLETDEMWQDETIQARIADLESLLTERDEKLSLAYTRVT